ncbi:hypothetical protein GTY54_22340 [Streptomyces sp. SID625]|nr:hypothetical protein [Streptomyces sp. SID625]
MTTHLTGDAAVAAALTHLLTEHPQLDALTWAVGETPGVLTGRQYAETGHGEIIDACADILGGHVVRSSQQHPAGGHGVAQLVTIYDEVPVEVWASYMLPEGSLTAAELRHVLTGRRLGTVADLEGGDDA